MKQYTFYCDESGSTGTNWLDNEQPFFIYGGWLVPTRSITKIEVLAKEILSNHQNKEFKSKRFYKRANSISDFNSIFDMMLKNKALPFFVIGEKKFLVASKIVETFFDYAYNYALKTSITGDFEFKKQLVELLVENDSEAILDKFSLLIKTGSINYDKMDEIRNDLACFFEKFKITTISNNLRNLSKEELFEMIDEFEIVSKKGTKKTVLTLTIPLLVALTQNLELLCQSMNFSTSIIHDEIRGYDDDFETIRTIFFSGKENLVVKTPTFMFQSSLNHIKSFDIKSSEKVFFIQLADLLCGFLNKAFKKIRYGETLSDVEKNILKKLISLHFCWMYNFTETFLYKFANMVVDKSEKPKLITPRKIDKKFSMYCK